MGAAADFVTNEILVNHPHLIINNAVRVEHMGVTKGLYNALLHDHLYKGFEDLFGRHILQESDDMEWGILSVLPKPKELEVQDVVFD